MPGRATRGQFPFQIGGRRGGPSRRPFQPVSLGAGGGPPGLPGPTCRPPIRCLAWPPEASGPGPTLDQNRRIRTRDLPLLTQVIGGSPFRPFQLQSVLNRSNTANRPFNLGPSGLPTNCCCPGQPPFFTVAPRGDRLLWAQGRACHRPSPWLWRSARALWPLQPKGLGGPGLGRQAGAALLRSLPGGMASYGLGGGPATCPAPGCGAEARALLAPEAAGRPSPAA